MIGLYYHDLFAQHLKDYGHIERPERLKAVMKRIHDSPIASSIKVIEAQPAERAWIERVHDAQYVESILSLEIKDAVILDWGDTIATPATPQAALYAAGCSVQACRDVLKGDITAGFCAVRPPGHHAEHNRAMGFCIFNNIAIAAADLVAEAGLSRVVILDWDVHHGNGTERTFLDDDKVLYISLHQYPHYPGTGHDSMTGTGRGVGYTVNIPLGTGAGDDDYINAFTNVVIPSMNDFKPEFVLISAGFDAHMTDPISSTNLSSAVFGKLTAMVKEVADRHCSGHIVSILEGGYNLEALGESVEIHLKALIG